MGHPTSGLSITSLPEGAPGAAEGSKPGRKPRMAGPLVTASPVNWSEAGWSPTVREGSGGQRELTGNTGLEH